MGRKAEDTVVIRNIYVMMAYAFKALDVKEYSRLGKESFENYASLLAAILCIGISIQRRRGVEAPPALKPPVGHARSALSTSGRRTLR